ncbi:hypothetical protein C2S52_023297 [Perilla frutescens var. hirtella]|nr:hypothetical protein C2S52_023297 [Perilla frutescens var. hirtella]
MTNNFNEVRGGRILLLWNQHTTEIEVISTTNQAIHYRITCKTTKYVFIASFVYGYWSTPTRRPLWNSFHIPELDANTPWLVMEYDIREFYDFCACKSFTDIESTGAKYTWTNGTVRSKLDRAMVNNAWLEIVKLFGDRPSVPKPFKFHNMWICHPKFHQLVEEEWVDRDNGIAQFRFAKKLKQLQQYLKQLNKDEYEAISHKDDEAKVELQALQIRAEENPLNVDIQNQVLEVRKRALFLAEAERQFFSQKAKCKYLLESDRNTKFFHATVKKNNTKHSINTLVREDGTLVEDLDQITYDFVEYYNELFGIETQTLPIDEESFLREVLLGLGFPRVMVCWIIECVSTATYSLSINGGIHGFIVGKRGLRQGDPMSPQLFLLCMEYLARLINKRTTNSDFNYHARCQKLKITHLAFADDLMLFMRGDYRSVQIIMETMKEFEGTSGLQINNHKSALFTAGLSDYELTSIQQLVGFPIGNWHVRYLGIPLTTKKLSMVDYTSLIDKISTTINVWSAKTLSYAGRTELIRSVLQGIECHWLQTFPLPVVCTNYIISLCRNFL